MSRFNIKSLKRLGISIESLGDACKTTGDGWCDVDTGSPQYRAAIAATTDSATVEQLRRMREAGSVEKGCCGQ